MSMMDFPVGNPKFFEGSMDLLKDNLFGFIRARITAPHDLATQCGQGRPLYTLGRLASPKHRAGYPPLFWVANLS